MAFNQLVLSALLLAAALLLIISSSSLIGSLRSQNHPGLNSTVCKCEQSKQDSGQPRIVNGTAFTSRRGLPWIASIHLRIPIPLKNLTDSDGNPNSTILSMSAHFCTGSLLSARWVLSASHCIRKVFNSPAIGLVFVSAGSDHDLSHIFCSNPMSVLGIPFCDFKDEHSYTRRAVNFHIHPKYLEAKNKNMSFEIGMFDIALLEVLPFTLSEELNILPGCLFDSKDYSYGNQLLAAGYGDKQPVPPEEMRKSRVIEGRTNKDGKIEKLENDTKLYTTQLSQVNCFDEIVEMAKKMKASLEEVEKIPRDFEKLATVCVRNMYSSVCFGDSGGPLLYSPRDGGKQFIVAVASRIFPKNLTGFLCGPDSTGFYTMVYPHLDWIRNVIGDEACFTNAFQFKLRNHWVHLLAATLSMLIVALVTSLILSEIRKPSNNLAPKSPTK